MPLIEIETFHDVAAAEVARSALDAAGIPAVLFDAGFSGLLGGGPGIRLVVDVDDEAAARLLLGTTFG